jgi:hypothetical protein
MEVLVDFLPTYISMSRKTFYFSFIHKLLAKFFHIYVNYEDGGM